MQRIGIAALIAIVTEAAIDPALATELNDQAAAIERNWGAVGGAAGGTAAYNEVVNNYLKHDEDEQRLKKKAACATASDPSSCRKNVEKAYNQIGRTRQLRTCSDADSCRANQREIEEDIRITSSRQKLLDQKLYNGELTAQERDEYYSNGQQIQLMQAALQEANRQFRYVVPMSQWTSQERESAFSDSMMALGGVGAAAAVGGIKSTSNTKVELAVESPEKSASSGTLGLADEANAALPMGSKVNQMNQPKNPSYQPVRNDSARVDGTDYAGHALDRMQDRGITPSVVQNTINVGVSTPSRGGTTVYYDSVNNVSVVVNAAGKVVTVKYGK